MLLKLKQKANLTLAMGTLSLPPQFTFIRPRRMCWVAGWGKTDVKEPASSTLQEVELRIMEHRAWSHFPAFDHNLQLCVGNTQSTKFAFKGDSGGPLLCAGVAQGIVSYGQSNAKHPAVFTRISHYRPWIDEVLNEN
ncbi:mast cell protease 2-like [Cervus canadensis]|uniref:mast cell protease 2-like n=1 Tax=Cervus canadensis TaxID=1574408 RepID=UPI001C9E29EC|nr:mast cell protease 2-like [Cervus canadensis]